VNGGSKAGGAGGGGAVRIIWGPGRAFPSTLTQDQPVIDPSDVIQDTDLFLLSDPDDNANYKCQASNLVKYGGHRVLVQEDDNINPTTSYFCSLANLQGRVNDNHWLLVNRGPLSYKVKATTLLVKYGPFNFVPVDKPSGSGQIRVGGHQITSLSTSASSSVDWWVNTASPSTLDHLYHVGVYPSNSSGFDMDDNSRKGTNKAQSWDEVVQQIDSGEGWTLSLQRSTNKVTNAEFSTTGQSTHKAGYPPGQYLAEPSRLYAQHMGFMNTGGETDRWLSNEDPTLRLEGREFTVDVTGLSATQALAIIVYPSAIPYDTSEVLVDNPDAIKYATKGLTNSPWDRNVRYFETPDAYNGSIQFRSNSDYTWVVTQVINYDIPENTYTPEQWRTYVEGLNYTRLAPTSGSNRNKGIGNYWTDAIAKSGQAYGSPRASNCDPEGTLSRCVQHMVGSEAEFDWLVANNVPIIWIVNTGGTATSFGSYTFNGHTSQAFNDGTAYPKWRNIECQWLRSDGQVWRRFGCSNTNTTGTLERISPF